MKKKIFSLAVLSSVVLPFAVFADAVTSTIENIIQWLTTVGGGVAVIFIIFAGFLMVTANGDTTKIDTGKKIITYAALGLIVILLARALATIIAAWVA